MKFAVVGSGFSGSVIAYELSQAGHDIDVFESRNHIGGNCFTTRDEDTNVMLHLYGPHIFHTDNEDVWNYVSSFTNFKPYVARVKCTTKDQIFSLPINLHTINQFFNKTFSPKEAEVFLDSIRDKTIESPKSFEELALQSVGKELYEAFFKEYAIKQWGINPRDIPASVLSRLPLRFNYDDNYFRHAYQGIPEEGYTPIFEKLLNHKSIKLHMGVSFNKASIEKFDHVFYTGPIDGWFNYEHGHLGYRTLDFMPEVHKGDYQGCAVMSYPSSNIPYTRITEHKHFTPWENHESTVVYKEYSRLCEGNDIPYYPIRQVNEKAMLRLFLKESRKEKKVSFIGRLGTYRYLDMDVTIAEALVVAKQTLKVIEKGGVIPVFFVDPA